MQLNSRVLTPYADQLAGLTEMIEVARPCSAGVIWELASSVQ